MLLALQVLGERSRRSSARRLYPCVGRSEVFVLLANGRQADTSARRSARRRLPRS